MQGYKQVQSENAILKHWRSLVVFLICAYAVACIGNLITAPALVDWFADLEKPAYTPPGWVFGAAWSSLYSSMAIAAWRVWLRRYLRKNIATALILYHVQLILNLAWTISFFGMHNPLLALAAIVLLQLANIATAASFHKIDRLSGFLFIPYILWVSFATILNFYICLAN